MNSCILLAQIIKEPELRYTAESQAATVQMLIQFPSLRSEDPPSTMRAVGWGDLANEIKERYHEGETILIHGRIQINTIERPEGFKEKRPEILISKIYPLGTDLLIDSHASAVAPKPNNVIPMKPISPPEEDFDDIPF